MRNDYKIRPRPGFKAGGKAKKGFPDLNKDGKTTFTPEVKLAVNQEFGDDTITTTNTYQGGGASFKNSTAIEKTSATAGVGLNISSDNVSFNIGYEADVRDKYLGHSAQAKITAKF
jgi:outer membrane autotransporter protein